MTTKRTTPILRKGISAILSIILIIGICVVPSGVSANELNFKYQKVYSFSENSNVQYGDALVSDIFGAEHQISRAHFGYKRTGEEEYLRIWNLKEQEAPAYDSYLLNDTDGLFELMPSSEYTVTMKVKVKEVHLPFTKAGISHPTADQYSKLYLSYGIPEATGESTTADTAVGLIAKVGSDAATFVAEQDGEKSFAVGQWHTFTYNFTTPDTFDENGELLGLTLESYNGVEIYIDEIKINKICYITVNAGDGTISKTKFAHKIGDNINIETPVYKFGYDFEGWCTDSALQNKFTDTVITRENCEATLYAKYSNTHFSFESYIPANELYSLNTPFHKIIESEDAPDGKKVLEYRYVPETYNSVYKETSLWSSRRTQRDNACSLRNLSPNTTYAVTFKYKVEQGACTAFMSTSNGDMWGNGCYTEYSSTKLTLRPDATGQWQSGRMVFTTGDLKSTTTNRDADCAFFMLYASTHTDTVAYIDDVNIGAVQGDMSVTLNANGGQFKDNSTVKKTTITFGQKVMELEYPVREGYDFAGWFTTKECTTKVNDYADSDIALRTVYAGWTRNMGFESYYYDIVSSGSNKYFSENASIAEETAYSGRYALKIENKASATDNVVILNPIQNKERYLVTFNYRAESLSSDLNVRFATMNMDKNDPDEFKLYDSTYTIKTSEAGDNYHIGALIIETEFLSSNANKLALVVSSNSAADYKVYIDDIALDMIDDNEGYVLINDEHSKNKAVIGEIQDQVKIEEPSEKAAKFFGFYTDKAYTQSYSGGMTYSLAGSSLYAKWVLGNGFEDYDQSVENVALTQDSTNVDNKYLTFTNTATVNIGSVTAGKKYGVDVRFNIDSSTTADIQLSVAGSTQTKKSHLAGAGWLFTTFVVTPTENSLTLTVTPTDTATVHIDDVIIYEITDSVSVITFDESDTRGEDSVRAGAVGTKINFPEKFAYGTDIFYGWCTDSALKNPFVDTVFTTVGETTLYACWGEDWSANVTFDDLGDNVARLFTHTYSATKASSTYHHSGSYSVYFEKSIFSSSASYFPLANEDGEDGLVRLSPNTDYVISFYYRFADDQARNLTLYAYQENSFSTSKQLASVSLAPAESWAKYTVRFTTDSSDYDVLYFYNKGELFESYDIYFDTIELKKLPANANETLIYDYITGATYEYNGLYGAPITPPEIDGQYYEIGGVYTDQEFTSKTTFTHKNDSYTNLYISYKLKDIEFDNYEYASSDSRYVRGDDVTVSNEESYRTRSSLKYSYSYSPNYDMSTKNIAALGYVADNTPYKVTFRYKLVDSQGDVDIKFRTAYKGSYFGLYTEYNDATYRIYSGEKGDSWQKAEVYFTTDFATVGTTHLYMSFNPVVEGTTLLYIDSVTVDIVEPDKAVVAFLGQDGRAGKYAVTKAGSSVSKPTTPPASQFAAFEGYYTDEALTASYTATALSAGITKVYSKWNVNKENFANYAYESVNEKVQAFVSVKDGAVTYTSEGKQGYFRLGKIENNTTYKVTFNYKTSNPGVKISFVTASETDINVNRTDYIDEGNYRVVSTSNADGTLRSGVLYFTSSFTYTVPNDKNVNVKENDNAVFGDMLYVSVEGAEGNAVTLDNFAIEKIDVLSEAGAMVLTEEASDVVGGQAMRFCFGYKTTDFVNVAVGSDSLALVERGIIFKNARNTATGTYTEDGVVVSPATLFNSDKKGHAVLSKTYGFNEYWDYSGEEMIYSGYITDFAKRDARLMSARGYLKLKDEYNNIYTIYSDEAKITVKEAEDINSEITNVDVHTIAGKKWSEFTIVHPKAMSYIYGQQIEFLIDYAKSTHNVTLNTVTEKEDAIRNEIVIGNTKRSSSSAVKINDENKYVIAVTDGRLIIKGGSDLATMQAVKDFIEYLKMKDGLGCGADLYEGFRLEGKVKKTSDNYALTFADEFNASQMDVSVWQDHDGRKMGTWSGRTTMLGGQTDFRNPGDPGYTTYKGRVVDKGIFTTDGKAVLTAARVGEGGINNIASEMSTMRTMGYKYGMWEIKAKLSAPVSYTGFWTQATDSATLYHRDVQTYRTEIDLLENFGKANHVVPNVHYWWNAANKLDNGHFSLDSKDYNDLREYWYTPDSDEESINDDYHTFTYLWTEDKEIFAFDGKKYFEFKSDHNQNVSTDYLIISQCICAVGMGEEAWNLEENEALQANDYYETYLDYVRIYQREDEGSELNWARK